MGKTAQQKKTSRAVHIASWKGLTPLGDKILAVRLDTDKTKTIDGLTLYLPDKQDNKNLWCQVLKVGKGFFAGGQWHRRPVKPGDVVCVRQFEGDRVAFQSISEIDETIHDAEEGFTVQAGEVIIFEGYALDGRGV